MYKPVQSPHSLLPTLLGSTATRHHITLLIESDGPFDREISPLTMTPFGNYPRTWTGLRTAILMAPTTCGYRAIVSARSSLPLSVPRQPFSTSLPSSLSMDAIRVQSMTIPSYWPQLTMPTRTSSSWPGDTAKASQLRHGHGSLSTSWRHTPP